MFRDFNKEMLKGFGIGLSVQRQIINGLFVEIGFQWSQFATGKELNAKNDTQFNGYYFQGNDPYLFQKLSLEHTQIRVPLLLAYGWQKWSPFLGIAYSNSLYNASFAHSSGIQPVQFDETRSVKMSVANFGYCLGLRFKCTDAFSVGMQYSYIKSPGVHFLDENGSQLFAPAMNVEENQWTFSCLLHII